MRFVTFTSDFGGSDEYVGVCHAVIARIAPGVHVVDLGHGVEGVRAGAAVLAQSLPYAPLGVHLAVVDPGVGTTRRAIAVQTASRAVLVGPDNGLLPDAAETLGGVVRVVELTDERYRLHPTSATFHGRDIFAPAAAHLATGVPLAEFGPAVSSASLERLAPPTVEIGEGSVRADVVRCDRFGNVQTAAGADALPGLGDGGRCIVEVAGGAFEAVTGRTFADARHGGLVVLADSAGMLAIVVNGGSARTLLGSPAEVRIRRLD